MLIKRILTNNALVTEDVNGSEIIVCGKGIGFKKRAGDWIDEQRINQVFVLNDNVQNKHFQEIISEIPLESIELTNEIIEMIKTNLGKKLNDVIYITLSDHLYMAIQRKKQGISVKNQLTLEIKHFYEKEFQLGINALEIVKKNLNIELSEDEAAFIALHIVNAETENNNLEQTVKMTQMMNEICNIVGRYFSIQLNTESVYYFRFITHLKFFAQRFMEEKEYQDNIEKEIFELVKKKYQTSYSCVLKISEFIYDKYKYKLTDEERMYLTIHIERVVYKNKD
ncbi:PRD domain-containing protein [Enterococcus avium]|uniref:BglG family transcription antiterminator LicT n=1 Tax=Enterococcus avium TaxID=33945 RepID=UPI00159DED11|nr:PRD domain-containing protein [Enterococcus avium]NVN78021.1 PRD domain-containing protein [Enterococcus avium]